MTALPLLLNLTAYAAQIACIVAVGALASALLRIDVPAIRYAYWRAVLVLSLLLPWVQSRVVVRGEPATAIATIGVASRPAAGAAAVAPDTAALSAWPRTILAIVAAGAILRVIWIAVGLLRLRRLRRAGTPLELTPIDDAYRRTLAPHAMVRVVSSLRQPVTFGWRQPVVLIPERLRAHEAPVREAVLCHEFHHVDRRDWPWVLFEQIVTAAFWFHPAMWWVVSRVQLAREEVVDALVVRTTGARRTYIEALMAFADSAPRMPVAPFARRRHLFGRIQLIAKERVMSVPRIVLSSMILATVTAAAVWYSSERFPLAAAGTPQQVTETPGPLERIATPAIDYAAIPRLQLSVGAAYPPEAAAVNVSGAVVVKLVVGQDGQVVEIRPTALAVGDRDGRYVGSKGAPAQADPLFSALGDPGTSMKLAADAMLRSAEDAVARWRFEPPPIGPVSFYVMLTMGPAIAPAGPGLRPSTILSVAEPTVPSQREFTGAGNGIAVGVRAAANGTAPRTTVSFGRGSGQAGPSAATRAAATAVPSFTAAPPPPPPPAPQPGSFASGVQPLRVGGIVQAPKKIKDVKPVYPKEARDAGTWGIVIIEATIDIDGTVVDTKVLRSIPQLDDAAIDAVRQWQFVPTLLNGAPVPLVMSVTINFQLN